jgi:hypothetical protein
MYPEHSKCQLHSTGIHDIADKVVYIGLKWESEFRYGRSVSTALVRGFDYDLTFKRVRLRETF